MTSVVSGATSVMVKSTCAVRHIFAVGIADEVSIGVGHEELNIGDRFVRCSIDLSN